MRYEDAFHSYPANDEGGGIRWDSMADVPNRNATTY